MKKKKASKKKTGPAKKKAGTKRKSAAKKMAVRRPAKKRAVKKTAPARKKSAAKKTRPAKKRVARKATASRKKPAAKKAIALRKTVAPRSRPYMREDDETTSADFDLTEPPTERGLGLESGGQSGDTEGLSRSEIADSESVEELLEEGQAFEAGIISGVENAPDADRGGIRTRQFPEDDVPQEYLDQD